MRIQHAAIAALLPIAAACGTATPTLTAQEPTSTTTPTYACAGDLVDTHEEIVAIPTGPQDPDQALNAWLTDRGARARAADLLAGERTASSVTYLLVDDDGSLSATIRASKAGAAWAITDYEYCAEDAADLGAGS